MRVLRWSVFRSLMRIRPGILCWRRLWRWRRGRRLPSLRYVCFCPLFVNRPKFTPVQHRDLHCSNICIRQRHQQCNPIKNGIKPTSASTAHKYGQSGLEVVFIDYTLSRAKTKNGETYFMDLESALEVHTWDVNLPAKNPMEKLQHETYRRMRNYVLFGQPVVRLPRDKVKASGKEWKEYKPYTNVLWVRYVVSYVIWKLENRLGLGQDGKGFMSGIRPLVERLDPNRAGRPERGGFGSAVEVLRFCVERGWITREDLSELGYECGDGSDAAGSE
jgi:serine/threonine-protein kinase haspin